MLPAAIKGTPAFLRRKMSLKRNMTDVPVDPEGFRLAVGVYIVHQISVKVRERDSWGVEKL